MRKNAIRKILHGILDLLPLLVIPTFMIYARNENSTFGSEVTIHQDKIVDFNQQAQLKTSDFSSNGVDYVSIEGGYYISGTATGKSNPYIIEGNTNAGPIVAGHKYLLRGFYGNGSTATYCLRLQLRFNPQPPYGYQQITDSGNGVIFSTSDSTARYGIYFEVASGQEVDVACYPCLFDLTQMFGVGNEPTIQQFNTWFSNDFYSYTLSEKVLIEDYDVVTYNDTDIGSQMVYVLYNTVDKYFNMNNVFGMNNVYSWFELNIFGGTAPLAIYIVWNIVLYEFVMDLLMLLYGLFMWFIDMIKSLMEKPINAIK